MVLGGVSFNKKYDPFYPKEPFFNGNVSVGSWEAQIFTDGKWLVFSQFPTFLMNVDVSGLLRFKGSHIQRCKILNVDSRIALQNGNFNGDF